MGYAWSTGVTVAGDFGERSVAWGAGMIASPFLLKTAPPRLGRALFARPRRDQRWSEISDRTAIIVTAPQGFGKTTLLAQWRRRWLERGAFVAWVSLDAQDDRSQFVDVLLFALRAATGRESFATAAIQSRLQESRELEALTTLLAEVAALATPTVIVLDDAHRMPQAALRELLSYLLNNAPPNLQFLIGSRRPLELQLTDLLAAGRLANVDAGDLRLKLEESVEFLRSRFGSKLGMDDAVRLHELTEGWPLGLQLAAATIERASDPNAMVRQLNARRGDIQRFFFETLLSQRTDEEAGFLVRISILDTVSADLCAAVTLHPDAARLLDQMVRSSPLVMEGEDREWVRLHAMGRDFLLGQFDKLAVEERRACYERAAAWYADHGQFQEAARHAWAAGNEELAVQHASRCLREIGSEGRVGEARDWMRRLPPSVVARDVRLQLTAAWIQALSDGAETVPGLIAQVRKHPQFDATCALEAALVSAAAGTFCDKPGLVAEALREIEEPLPVATPLHVVSLANQRSIVALHSGDTERARQILGECLAAVRREPSLRLPLGFADLTTGLSYLWEGNPARAIGVLQPRLDAAEREMGRRSMVASILAGAYAAALYLQDSMDAAVATLADRLDVIERAGMPDPVVLAYRVLADVSARRGDHRRALDTLQSMYDIGLSRDLPRLVVASLLGQVRIHVMGSRVETAEEVLASAQSLRSTFERPEYRPFLRMLNTRLAVATASVRLSRSDPEGADAVLRSVAEAPAWLRCSPDVLAWRALRALAAHQLGRPGARELLDEAVSLAELRGMRRIVEEVHPGLAGLIVPAGPASTGETALGAAQRNDRATRGSTAAPGEASPASGLLTPKEAQILSLLASGMANKEIAR
ncbi:MAG: hypothetical protein FIB04_06085, partial [Gammaproteobacteria bacterium]|nr:hypothetical protein [Gammaproteobacteria bacterium]